MSTLKFDALVKRYEAEIAEAKAILEVYFVNSVGIGEHPQIIEEMDKLVEQLATSQDKLQALQKLVYIHNEDEEEGEEE